MSTNILLVEDDEPLAEGLKLALGRENYSVNWVGKGQQAIASFMQAAPDLVILDLGLPDMDGLAVLAKLKSIEPSVPALILTARSSIDEKVAGLDRGADDYLAKPFELPELLARIRVLERRVSQSSTHRLIVKDVSLDTLAHQAFFQNELVDLPRREYMLLKVLMENVDRIQTRETLESKLYSWGEEVASNALEVHVHHLRKKFGTLFIKTVRGVGYTVRSH